MEILTVLITPITLLIWSFANIDIDKEKKNYKNRKDKNKDNN